MTGQPKIWLSIKDCLTVTIKTDRNAPMTLRVFIANNITAINWRDTTHFGSKDDYCTGCRNRFTVCLFNPWISIWVITSWWLNSSVVLKLVALGLLTDRMLTLDCHRNTCSLCMAWIDVRKAYNTVDYGWLRKIMRVDGFPDCMCEVVSKLCASWNSRVGIWEIKTNPL